ncbi:hypothetical protein TVAG_486920 [Trichomonas vaginalis G3]|uniref:Uncharacterized protein n=1 Tax=Trichomonas vaginalis (strain ATCC PRA-98 / G3) TaxID=412133 RepID=A2DZC0_TRIV3|nr:hypothetical protein TVAGG3_1017270 [Trichomonas vaginalis G3]EAY14249.1 hypothetical protein TVAG_486920 [Trichomonas vaginalis G3]KAI5491893.1 hypothetical protein TVAGG3_1017270 [Trichomonas vaginalis G3]|eukprot:XP_001326472.1 hypothetical protein [Trichomonas vaginalis G3]
MDEKLLAMLAEDDSNIDAFNIDSDDIDFDAIPKKSDLEKKKINRKPIKCVIPSDSDSDPFTIDTAPPRTETNTVADSLNSLSSPFGNDDLLFSDDSKKTSNLKPAAKAPEIKPEVKIQDTQPKQIISEKKEILKPQTTISPVNDPKPVDNKQKWQTTTPAPAPVPSKLYNQMSPIEAFEYSLVSYLERASQDATHSFLDEFKFQLNQAASYENIISTFLSDLNGDIKRIVTEESASQPQPDSLTELNNIINEQFAQISKQIPHLETKKENTEPYSVINNQINTTIEDFSAKCTPLLMDLKKEVLQQNSTYFDGTEASKEKVLQQKKLLSDLETYSYQQDVEQEYLAKRVQRLKQQQVAFHEQSLSVFTKDTDDEEKVISGDLESLVDELQHYNNNDNDIIFDGYSDSIDQKIRELINLNSTLIGATERILHLPMQAHPEMTMPMPQPSAQSSFIQSSSFLNDSHMEYRNEVVANVRERLENLRRKAEKSAKNTSFSQNAY